MSISGEGDFLVDRRTKLDGGLNSHADVFALNEDQASSLFNFRADQDGALTLRDGASLIATSAYPVAGAPAANQRLPALTVEVIAGGALPQPETYAVKALIRSWNSSSPVGATTEVTSAATSAGNQALTISLYPLNAGEGAGQGGSGDPTLIDDPFMGGLFNAVEIYVERSGVPGTFYKQHASTVALTWSTANRRYEYTLNTFTQAQGTFSGDNDEPLPIRYMHYHEVANLAVVLVADRGYQFPTFQAIGGLNEWHTPTDKDAASYYLSRLPGPMQIAEIGNVMILTDGVRPKKANIGDGSGSSPFTTPAATSEWRMLGANPPDAVPTLADSGVGGLPNGTYFYRQTFIYKTNKAQSRQATESWYSESMPVTSASITVALKKVTVTLNAAEGESGLYLVRLYRTEASGGTYYRLADIAPATGTYTDNTDDATLLGRKTDPSFAGKIPVDVPPRRLLYVCEQDNRCFGVVGKPVTVSSTDLRIRDIAGTTVVRVSLNQLIGDASEDPSVVPDTESIETSVDAWPDTLDYTILCGGGGQINALEPFRGQVYVFKTTSIGVVSGTQPGTYTYQELYSDIGAVAASVRNAEGTIYFLNAEKGPFAFDGRSYLWIGKQIRDEWTTLRDTGYYCSNVVHDRDTDEIRWSLTTALTDPLQNKLGDSDNNFGEWIEYVFYIPAGTWWIFTGADVGQDRTVRASENIQTPGYLNPQVTSLQTHLGDVQGRVLKDHGAVTDTGVSVSASVIFKFAWFGETFDWTKLYRSVMAIYTLGARTTGSILVQARTSAGSAWATVATLTAQTTGQGFVLVDVPSPVESGANITLDHGLQIKVVATVNCPFVLKALVVRSIKQAWDRKVV